MDILIKKIAGLGVPGLVLLVAIHLSGLFGAAAITASLAAIGPGGMIGGIITLGLIGLIADGLAEYGFDAIAKGVVKELYRRGESKDTIRDKIHKYPITSKMKNNLFQVINNIE